MFRNYMKIAIRNLLKTRAYSIINIGGLAVGMAIAMLIGLWIHDEISYDKNFKNYDRIAQVMVTGRFNGEAFTSESLARPLEAELRNKYGSSFRHIVMSRYTEDHILSIGDKKITRFGKFMQPGVIEMLSLNMISGTKDALKDISSVIISESTAKSLFGSDNPMGQVVKLDNRNDLKVSGVYEDIAYSSSFSDLQFIAPWDLTIANNPWMQEAADNWGNTSFLMYVEIQPNTNFEAVSKRIQKAVHDNVEEVDKKFNIQTFLHPMNRWHLFSEWTNGHNTGGRIQFVWLFGIIGVFVLLLACINFMNLSTARSEKRAKEVGIRKAIGSLRSQLIRQFLCESFLVVIIAFLISIVLVAISLPLFNEIADKKMNIMWDQPLFWIISLLFIVLTSVVSGSYPAFYLSSFNAVKVLKGTFQAGRFSAVPRKVLVVLQFTVSVALIIGTIIVYRQIQHAKNRPVGYNRQGLVMIQIRSQDLETKTNVIENLLKEQGVIESMATSSSPLTAVWDNNGGFEWTGKDPNKVQSFATVYVTHDYGKTVGWKFNAGRDFSREFASDSVGDRNPETVYGLVVNEAAVRYMGLKNPVGEIVRWGGQPLRIIGVIKDMVMESPFNPVRQTVYLWRPASSYGWINLRINRSLSASEALSKTEKVFAKVVPSVPFDYKFADTEYQNKFIVEERIGKLASVFASLAVFISCLGLFGLASFVAEKRTKEIGIRKVLGATVFNLWKMLSKDFVALVVLSCCIAAPLAYYFLSGWLQKYEYRTEITWWVFAAAIGGALLITILTVSFQAIRAALSNPIKSLRTE
jgi:putative ABC transport system permease protein